MTSSFASCTNHNLECPHAGAGRLPCHCCERRLCIAWSAPHNEKRAGWAQLCGMPVNHQEDDPLCKLRLRHKDMHLHCTQYG
eukprot:3978574-Amphidinium_carterae.1